MNVTSETGGQGKRGRHKGMLRPILLIESGEILERKKVDPEPLPNGPDRIREQLPRHEEVRNLLWNDRNPETLNFDPEIAKKTW